MDIMKIEMKKNKTHQMMKGVIRRIVETFSSEFRT